MRLESLHELLGQEELVPQAILRIPIERLAIQHSIKLEVGADDFDKYVGAAFRLDDTRFAIMHYAGHPDGTSTIYLPYSINDVVKISYFISKIASELGLSATDFEWQRKDDLTKSAS